MVTNAPAVTPTPYVLTGLTRSTNSTEGANAVDANPETVWTITDDGSSPIGGLILDYGQILPIGMIRALPGNGGLRGEGVIQVSPDGIAWHTYGTLPQDAVAEPDGWIVIMPTGPEPVPTTTRYVRVVYLLAGGEVAVANIAEVEMLPPNP
ncbi:MAG TPA: discoidin domain-containing protein [Thermomicrobiales bacterium]|nr:discoidin domain-containing protein [Thermomicrobiales bacterium]